MPPEAALIGVFFISILALWAYVMEAELKEEETEERKLFDKSKLKYTDGDNT